MGKYQQERFNNKPRQCDLVRRKDGKWFLLVTVDVPEGAPIPTTDFLGVDLGVVNIATDSDGEVHTNAETEDVRQRYGKTRRIDPRNTSRTCPECGHIAKGNRLVRGIFLCRECGHFDHADTVGAINIACAARVAVREVSVAALAA